MRKLSYTAPFLLGAAPALLMLASSGAAADDVSCRIDAEASHGSVRLEGLATAKTPVSGTYNLTVTTRGGGSTSNSEQGGVFNAGPGRESRLSQVDLGLNPGASYSATLRLEWPGGSHTCSKRS